MDIVTNLEVQNSIQAERIKVLEEAMTEFCERVEKGEVRSYYTYGKFCALLGRQPKI